MFDTGFLSIYIFKKIYIYKKTNLMILWVTDRLQSSQIWYDCALFQRKSKNTKRLLTARGQIYIEKHRKLLKLKLV